MKIVERENHKILVFPSTAACRICKYLTSDICEQCLEDNLADFEPKNIPLELLRSFTMDEYKELPNGVKEKLLAFYVIKIMEFLNGRDTDGLPGS